MFICQAVVARQGTAATENKIIIIIIIIILLYIIERVGSDRYPAYEACMAAPDPLGPRRVD